MKNKNYDHTFFLNDADMSYSYGSNHEHTSPTVASHVKELAKHINLEGRKILDIGSGTGEITRFLADNGAIVTGVECSPSQLQIARTKVSPDCRFIAGVGQFLPLENFSFEAAVFFNSLHHVPKEGIQQSLSEAVRVVKSGGIIYVAEPLAEGPCFELDSQVEDETEVRTRALEAIRNAPIVIPRLEDDSEEFYQTLHCYKNFENYREEMLRFNYSRRVRFEKLETELKRQFFQIGKQSRKGLCFMQPMRANILRVCL